MASFLDWFLSFNKVTNKYGPLFIELVLEISRVLISASITLLIIVSFNSVPILNKSSPIEIRIKAATQSYINKIISIESLSALYQSVDFSSEELNNKNIINHPYGSIPVNKDGFFDSEFNFEDKIS